MMQRSPKLPVRATRCIALLVACAGIATGSAQAQERLTRSTDADQLITPEVRQAAARGLAWLAAKQDPGGFWAQEVGFKLNTDYNVQAHDAPHVGVTALALMAFMAGGHVPGRGQYGDNLERGLDYVLSRVGDNGFISDAGSRMYSHAFATLFLAEIYGMTRRRDVREGLQRSVNLIVDSQNTEGGWRYRPFARESDISITVCQVLALRSARNVGIHVPYGTIRQAQSYVYRSAVSPNERSRYGRQRYGGWVNEGGAFRYQLRPNSRATFPLTAAGVTTLYAAGEYDAPEIDRALEYLDGQLPLFNRTYPKHYFFYYGHYYAVQAYYVTGGSKWQIYFRDMRRTLLDMQRSDGAWPCTTGPGDAFGTAVATLILQIPYQYLPIFQR